ncbi:MAG: hypothetical protein HY721_05475 [Planctomycetes bacterium]|nr:hypothetical protein [Planctomycetota bacterium]
MLRRLPALITVLSVVVCRPLGADTLPEWHVSPQAQGARDEAGRGRYKEIPFRTVQFALDQAVRHVTAPGYSGTLGARIILWPGNYTDDPAKGGAEAFPIQVPTVLEKVEIRAGLPPVPGDVTLGSVDSRLPIFMAGEGAPGDLALAFSSLKFEGGLLGVAVWRFGEHSASVHVQDCEFKGLNRRGLEVFVPPGGSAVVSARRCGFERSKGGVFVHLGLEAIGDVTVEECTFTRLTQYAPEDFLGAGVDLHRDRKANLGAAILRNEFEGVASAVQLSDAQEDPTMQPSGGTLKATIANNLVLGRPDADRESLARVTNGLYFSLWPHHRHEIWIANNTFIGISRRVIHHDNLDVLIENDLSIPFTFVNNIAWDVRSDSELDFESPDPEQGPIPDWTPPDGVVIRNNLLQKSRLGRDGVSGNFTADPGFQDPAQGDFSLRPDSPAVDRGDPAYADPSKGDLAGRCRRSSRDCRFDAEWYPVDLGALELPGNCDVEIFPFQRGDCNLSRGSPELTDAIFTFMVLFLGGTTASCEDACDTNDDGELNISDGIYTLSFLFSGGRAPPPPHGADGPDPTRDCLLPCSPGALPPPAPPWGREGPG